MINLIFDYKLYIILFLLIGKGSLKRFGIPIDIPFSAMYFVLFLIVFMMMVNRIKSFNKIKLNAINVGTICMYVYTILSIFISMDIENAFYLYTLPSIFIMTALILVLASIKDIEDIERILLYIYIVSMVLAIVGIKNIGNGRVSAFGGGPNTFYRFMLQGVAIAYLYISKGKKVKINFILMGLFIFMGLNTGSRGFIVTLLAMIIFNSLSNRKKSKRLIYLILFLLAIVMLSNNENFIKSMNDIIPSLSRVWDIFDIDKLMNSTSGETRVDLISISLKYFFNSSIVNMIFGLGPYSSVVISNNMGYPHNLFIEVLVEYGFIGIFILMTLICAYIYKSMSIYRYVKNTEYLYLYKCLNLILIVHFIGSMLSGYIIDSRLIFFMIIITSIFYDAIIENIKKRNYTI